MKNVFVLAVCSFFCMIQVLAQNHFREPFVKIGNNVLISEKLKSFDRYLVRDASFDTTHYTIVESENVRISNIKFKSQKIIHQIFCEVFSSERLIELSNSDKVFDMVYYVNNKGLVYQISYTIAFDSQLKPSELVKLDMLMKQKIQFTADEFVKTGNTKLHFSQLVSYEKILNREKIRPFYEWEYQ